MAELRSGLAAVLLEQGKYAEAEAQQRAAVELRRAALGDDHPAVALARNTLAEIASSQGKYAEAESEHRAALAVRERAFGPDHPEVANSRSNLGTVLHQLAGTRKRRNSSARRWLSRWMRSVPTIPTLAAPATTSR